MDTNQLIQLQNDYLLNTYAATLPLVRGSGTKVWDNDGNEYLDFTAGISVCNVGHCHPVVTEAIQRQAAKLVHVSNIFVNELQPQLAEAISRKSFGGRVFFANSGAEANEGLIKFARKWGSTRGRHGIIAMEHSFHGRTIATLAATDKPAIREGFGPLPEGFTFVSPNDLDALKAAIDDTTAAVLLEPIQGEGGVHPADGEYLAAVRELCDNEGILLLFDEVQTGIGRTGTLFGYQQYGVEPDAMSLAKALANGFPMGAFVVRRKWEDVMGPSSHATTFGGTPLACAAALAVLNVIETEEVLANVRDMGQHASGKLVQMAEKHQCIKDVRGPGLMLGVQLESAEMVADVIAACKAKGLLLISAAGGVLRIYPPLNIDKTLLDQGIAILDEVLGELA